MSPVRRRRGIAPLLVAGIAALGVGALYLMREPLGLVSQESYTPSSYYASTDSAAYLSDPYSYDPYYLDGSYPAAPVVASDLNETGLPSDEERRELWLAHMDRDRDGEISDTERETARLKLLDRLDQDGDGEVSEEERAAARADRIARHDSDGDGVVSEEERADGRAMRGPGRGKRRGHQDTDGDGEVSEAERQAAREAHQARRSDPEVQVLFQQAQAAHEALEASLVEGAPEAIESAQAALKTAQEALAAHRQRAGI